MMSQYSTDLTEKEDSESISMTVYSN